MLSIARLSRVTPMLVCMAVGLSSSEPACADDLERAAPTAAAPVYAVRSRFSDTAGIVSFSATRPAVRAKAPLRTASATALVAVTAAPAASATRPALDPLLIKGIPSARSGVRLTSRFGLRSDPFDRGGRNHAGLDLAAPYGSAVIVRSPGLVTSAGWLGGYGNCVVVDHGGGVQTRYGHLERIDVTVGQHVDSGTRLGLVGSTGRSTGPHLHYEVRLNGSAINPLSR